MCATNLARLPSDYSQDPEYKLVPGHGQLESSTIGIQVFDICHRNAGIAPYRRISRTHIIIATVGKEGRTGLGLTDSVRV